MNMQTNCLYTPPLWAVPQISLSYQFCYDLALLKPAYKTQLRQSYVRIPNPTKQTDKEMFSYV